jgi:hypothetical protein
VIAFVGERVYFLGQIKTETIDEWLEDSQSMSLSKNRSVETYTSSEKGGTRQRIRDYWLELEPLVETSSFDDVVPPTELDISLNVSDD